MISSQIEAIIRLKPAMTPASPTKASIVLSTASIRLMLAASVDRATPTSRAPASLLWDIAMLMSLLPVLRAKNFGLRYCEFVVPRQESKNRNKPPRAKGFQEQDTKGYPSGYPSKLH